MATTENSLFLAATKYRRKYSDFSDFCNFWQLEKTAENKEFILFFVAKNPLKITIFLFSMAFS
jgi:hypothetical protein